MTRKSKRELEREVDKLTERAEDNHGGILIMVEQDDGTITDPDGEPITEEQYEEARLVIDYVTADVAETWPDTDDSGAI
jgi:hypothetical protein